MAQKKEYPKMKYHKSYVPQHHSRVSVDDNGKSSGLMAPAQGKARLVHSSEQEALLPKEEWFDSPNEASGSHTYPPDEFQKFKDPSQQFELTDDDLIPSGETAKKRLSLTTDEMKAKLIDLGLKERDFSRKVDGKKVDLTDEELAQLLLDIESSQKAKA